MQKKKLIGSNPFHMVKKVLFGLESRVAHVM